MSLKSMSTPEKNTVQLEITIAKEAFDKAVNDAYRKNVGKMNVPGFRKGKAPKSIVEKMYGKGVFYEDALNALIPDAYEEALKESQAKAVSRPEFDVSSIEDDGVVFTAKFFVKPDVEIKDYKGIAADRTIRETTDAEIDAQIEAERNRNSRTVEVTDRAAQNGDTANIDYEGFCDGKAFDGGKAEKHDLKLGSESFIPGFEDQIVGHSIGDEFDVNVKFPEDYHAEELKGKDATFKVKLNGIKYTELPELD
ncbi:MAG: trigger factor, partial [Firmicutes bacterium]|nr:trigger factor [Bacillota bacterium]